MTWTIFAGLGGVRWAGCRPTCRSSASRKNGSMAETGGVPFKKINGDYREKKEALRLPDYEWNLQGRKDKPNVRREVYNRQPRERRI